VVIAFPLETVMEEPFLNTAPLTKLAVIPLEAEIFTLSNMMSEIDNSGKPHRMPALVEPVIVMFVNVMCFQLGVVLVTVCAGSDDGLLGVDG